MFYAINCIAFIIYQGVFQPKKPQPRRSVTEHEVPSGADQITHTNIFLLNLQAVKLK